LLDIIAKNPQQKSPSVEINGREIVQPFVWYTCPPNKTARVKGTVVCTGLGAAAEARFSVAGVIKYRWIPVVAISSSALSWTNDVSQGQRGVALILPPVGTERSFDVLLSDGQTIETSQSSGTNSEFNVFAEVTELPS